MKKVVFVTKNRTEPPGKRFVLEAWNGYQWGHIGESYVTRYGASRNAQYLVDMGFFSLIRVIDTKETKP